jgi:hypothetical protein
MKKVIVVAMTTVLSLSLFGMKRARPSGFSLDLAAKREHVDTPSSWTCSDELKRGSIFFGLKVLMDYEYTMPRQELNQFQKNFVERGITGDDEKGVLLQKYYVAFMNNTHAGKQAKIGGPQKYEINGQIFFQ